VTREELVLAVLAVGGSYQMSRLLKTVFLVSRNISEAVEPTFRFRPEYYGPVDPDVSKVVAELKQQGLANLYPFEEGHCYLYRATNSGIDKSRAILRRLGREEESYIVKVADWVRSENLLTLLGSIYQAYLDMRDDRILQFPSAARWDEIKLADFPVVLRPVEGGG
jgi:hypothetical protein